MNFWAKIFLYLRAFQKVQTHYAYKVYFARFYGPIIFLFAFFSVVLSRMQVDLTVATSVTNPQRNAKSFALHE